MNKADALHIAFTAIVRELLRDEAPEPVVETLSAFPRCSQCDPRKFPLCQMRGQCQQTEPAAAAPQPQFDFDESNDVCEHGGVWIDRATCPVHSDEAKEYVPTAEELDDITSDDSPEVLQRAARLKAQRERAASVGPLFPEDLPMRGMGPPADLP